MSDFDTSEYMEMFLAESREHLETLNNAIVTIEADPTNRKMIDDIFRVAHSFKGMSATMGYDQIASLTHEMEDVIELLRSHTREIPKDAVDIMFGCLDTLSTMVDEVEAGGAVKTNPEALVKRLKKLAAEAAIAPPIEQRDEPAPADLPKKKSTGGAATGKAVGPAKRRVAAKTAKQSAETTELEAATEADQAKAQPPAAESSAESDPDADAEPNAAPSAEPEPEAQTDRRADVPFDRRAGGRRASDAGVDPVNQALAERRGHSTVRVDSERLDALLHLVGELTVHRSAVEQIASQLGYNELTDIVSELTQTSQRVQEMVMRVRMIPVDAAFARLPRLVRDLAQQLGKSVVLELTGRDTELDRAAVEALVEPLVHLVRNAIDHGIEDPETRAALGKEPIGRLAISARHAGGDVIITVKDNGCGIDPVKVASAAVKRGLLSEDEAVRVDEEQAIELLFTPGFSTAAETTDISGRGVGMDAVRATVRGFGGDIFVRSVLGKGTTAEIRLPLTLAILPALLVDSGNEPYAIQLDRIDRTFLIEEVQISTVAGMETAVLTDRALQVVDLAAAFGRAASENPRFMVVVRSADKQLAVTVDSLEGQRDLVTRAVPDRVRGEAPIAGGAVLANGEIALIVDCDALAKEQPNGVSSGNRQGSTGGGTAADHRSAAASAP